MTLTFPNRSRSFDEGRHAVRFLGYDGVFEVPFLVDAAVFAKSSPAGATEASCLIAFDAARESVHDVARTAYTHARRKIYFLTAADFR